jgi:hypothetical protein
VPGKAHGGEVMCNCIEKVQEKLREDTGDPKARIKFSFSFTKDGIKEYIPIPATYRERKKDGTFGDMEERIIVGAYCPICGESIR